MYICNHCQKSFDKPRSLSAHRCNNSQRFKRAILENNRADIIDKYQNQKVSIVEIANDYGVNHGKVTEFLKENGLELDFWCNNERRAIRAIKSQNTTKERYGVNNVAQLQSSKDKVRATCEKRYGVTNGSASIISSVKHYILGNDVEPHLSNEYEKFKKEVVRVTQKNIEQLEFTGRCYYTEVEISRSCHFNNMFKATIDHKIPIVVGFEQGLSADAIGSVNNLAWCAKLVNTYKRSMTEEQFRASGIIERFKKYEGYLRNNSK